MQLAMQPWLRSFSERTRVAYRRDVLGFIAHISEPGKPTVADVERWLASLDQLSPASVNRKLAAVKSFAKFLAATGDHGWEPVRIFKARKVRERIAERIISEHDVVLLINAGACDRD